VSARAEPDRAIADDSDFSSICFFPRALRRQSNGLVSLAFHGIDKPVDFIMYTHINIM
jgi:hypothetical protein